MYKLLPHEIPGHLSREEGEWLCSEASGRIVLEIGALRGRSTAYLASSAAILFTCDHFLGQKTLLEGQRVLNMRQVEQDWHDNIEASALSEKVHLFRMSSKRCYDLLQEIKFNYFGLIFIDGGHDESSVAEDTRFATLLTRHGVIAFHDYHSKRFPDVHRAVDVWSRHQDDYLIPVPSAGSIQAFRRTCEPSANY